MNQYHFACWERALFRPLRRACLNYPTMSTSTVSFFLFSFSYHYSQCQQYSPQLQHLLTLLSLWKETWMDTLCPNTSKIIRDTASPTLPLEHSRALKSIFTNPLAMPPRMRTSSTKSHTGDSVLIRRAAAITRFRLKISTINAIIAVQMRWLSQLNSSCHHRVRNIYARRAMSQQRVLVYAGIIVGLVDKRSKIRHIEFQ